jgi:hypothetical protein
VWTILFSQFQNSTTNFGSKATLKAPDVVLAGTTLSNGPTKVDEQISPRSIHFISYPKQSRATSWLEKNCVRALTARGNVQETKCKQGFESLVAITSDYNHINVCICIYIQQSQTEPDSRTNERYVPPDFLTFGRLGCPTNIPNRCKSYP